MILASDRLKQIQVNTKLKIVTLIDDLSQRKYYSGKKKKPKNILFTYSHLRAYQPRTKAVKAPSD